MQRRSEDSSALVPAGKRSKQELAIHSGGGSGGAIVAAVRLALHV